MIELSVESIVLSLGYAGILILMVINGAISLPSSQILFILTGYLASTGTLNFWLVVVVGALGNTIGNILLYEAARSKGFHYVTKFKMFPPREVTKANMVFKKRGAWFLFVGKLLPAIKVFVPIPAGMAQMNRFLYTLLIVISSLIWATAFNAIGFFFGKSARVFGIYSIALFVVAGIVVYLFYKYMQSEEVKEELAAGTQRERANSSSAISNSHSPERD